jgi:peptidoglycan/LPS O-acetylase OafA/YrhL
VTWGGLFLQFWPAFLCGVALRLAYSTGLDPRSLFGKHELAGSLALCAILTAGLLLLTYGAPPLSFIHIAIAASLVLWTLGGIENACVARLKLQPRVRRLGTVLLRPFLLLGQCSYSLYLLHGKLFQLPNMFVRQIFSETNPMSLLSVVFGTSLLCYGFYLLVERPFQKDARAVKGRAKASRTEHDKPAVGPVSGDGEMVIAQHLNS